MVYIETHTKNELKENKSSVVRSKTVNKQKENAEMRRLTYLVIAIMAMAMVFEVEAGRRGGSRSSGGWSRSSSSKPKPKSSSWGNASKNKATKPRSTKATPKTTTKAPVKKKVVTPKKTLSAADKKRIEKAKTSGNYYTDKKSAKENFKKQHAKTYTSTYASKPTTRPAHIPQTYSTGGSSYPVVYRTNGYYYQNGLGQWLMYDMMMDDIMYNRYRRQHGYVMESDDYNVSHRVVPRPVVQEAPTTASGAIMGIVITIIIVGAVIALFVFFSKEKRA